MPDTELDRARAHLMQCRACLSFERIMLGSMNADLANTAAAERDFLAALSWVWDAQERAAAADHAGWFAGLKALPSCLDAIDPDVRAIMAQTQFTEFDVEAWREAMRKYSIVTAIEPAPPPGGEVLIVDAAWLRDFPRVEVNAFGVPRAQCEEFDRNEFARRLTGKRKQPPKIRARKRARAAA